MSPRPNTNCLEGMACPKCGYSVQFRIAVTTVAIVTDEGVDGTAGDINWGPESECECADCDHAGTVADFGGGN